MVKWKNLTTFVSVLWKCPDGGIGRHAGLKILFAEKASAGSIPAWGTDIYIKNKMEKLDIILTVIVLSAIVGTAIYMITQKKVEKSKEYWLFTTHSKW